ncbi:hypothetical protein VJ918_10615 [Adlercreutzia sp. R21]|nr:hypothetical protein [Adlercreutzia sp. R21]MEC4185261.1 hypothetical protein [Adlercreutzia sp. R21]
MRGLACGIAFCKYHDTGYSYTRLGAVENPEGLAEAVGPGTANIRFE